MSSIKLAAIAVTLSIAATAFGPSPASAQGTFADKAAHSARRQVGGAKGADDLVHSSRW